MIERAEQVETNSPEVEAAFEATPLEMVAEIIDGELHTHPRPRPRHARTSTKLGVCLGGPFDLGQGGPGGWIFLDEPELHLGPKPDKLVPDLAAWHRERFPVGAFADDAPGHIAVAPDWICEVLSKATEAIDRSKKLRIYAREGVGRVWLVNPLTRTLEVYRLERGTWIVAAVYEGAARERIEPFEAIELDLSLIWVGSSASG